MTDFAPLPGRAVAIDGALRGKLADSIDYLAGFLAAPAVLAGVGDRLRAGPVSPFLFCLYADVVARLSRNDRDGAEASAAALAGAAATDVADIVPYLSEPVPQYWWRAYHALLDTDPGRDFAPAAPSPAGLAAFRKQYEAARRIMMEGDPDLAAEVATLIRMAVPAAPSAEAADQRFNGASTFFAWGAALLNSEIDRHPVAVVDLLVHESGHLLLFGLVEGGALTTNPPQERYTSPLRSDPRPIDGVFHACFVATRVHAAMARLRASGTLDPQSLYVAEERGRYNGNAAIAGLDLLNTHALPTPKGQAILASLDAYWSNAAAA